MIINGITICNDKSIYTTNMSVIWFEQQHHVKHDLILIQKYYDRIWKHKKLKIYI
jgi:hypothetical protein